MQDKKTASYEVVKGKYGNIYRFFCDLSGSLVFTSEPISAKDKESELDLAWESGAREHFNKCRRCGSWTIAAMYNPDVLSCVKCSPIEDVPNFCPKCGVRAGSGAIFCHICGNRLMYGGGNTDEKAK